MKITVSVRPSQQAREVEVPDEIRSFSGSGLLSGACGSRATSQLRGALLERLCGRGWACFKFSGWAAGNEPLTASKIAKPTEARGENLPNLECAD